MSRKASPTVIGVFTLIGLILAVATMVLLGAGKLFKRTHSVLLYFDKSANGLQVGSDVRFGGVRIGKSILQCEVPREQLLKLISTGRSDLMRGFVSNRTKRKFDAFLTFDPKDGKVGFDFPPRAAKKAATKKE